MKRKNANNDFIVYLLAALLFLFALAGFMASDTLAGAMKAFTDKETSVAFITDQGVATEHGTIPVQEAELLVNNYIFVCYIAMASSIAIAVASLIRFKRYKL
jgi:hypothetical protein